MLIIVAETVKVKHILSFLIIEGHLNKSVWDLSCMEKVHLLYIYNMITCIGVDRNMLIILKDRLVM